MHSLLFENKMDSRREEVCFVIGFLYFLSIKKILVMLASASPILQKA